MFTKAVFGLAVVLATASGAFAATKSSIAPSHDVHSVYNPNGGYVGTDPDLNVRFELNRDWAHGHC
jgi:hypothetical protein